jgi:hypothetical protein
MEEQTQQQQLSQRIERDVRLLIGDQQMQILVLRALMDQAGIQQPGMQPMPEQPRTNGATPPHPEVR